MSRRLRFFHEQVTGAEIPMDPAMVDIGADLDELEVRTDCVPCPIACQYVQAAACCPTVSDDSLLEHAMHSKWF